VPALSKKQQKFMGIVRSIQKGEQPASKFNKDAQDVAKDMKKKDVKKFASTKHKGLPMKKEMFSKINKMIKQELKEYTYGVGDVVKDVNPSCPHYGAEGKVKSVSPRSVVFIVTNKGDNFKPGQELEKTHDQMKKTNEALSPKAKPLARGLSKSQKDTLEMMIDMQGLDQVMSDFKRDKKAFKQALADMSENINEDGHTDVASSKRKVMIMVDDSNKLLNKLNGMNKEDSLPSWWTDKITLSQNYLEKATNYITNPVESINENRDFEKLYNLFTKKDYFNLKNSIKQMLRNYDVALKKGDKGAQKYTKQDVIKSVTAQNKENAKRVYDELVTAIKKKDIRRLKSRLRYNQPYSMAIFNQITGKKLPKTTRDIHSFLDNEFMKESVKESMNPSAVKKMRDEFEKTGQLPPHLKKFAKDLNAMKKKHKVKNIVVPGLEWMSDMKEVNEFRDKREADTARDQIGNKALYMIGAKDFVFGTSGGKKSLVFKIMRNSKGVSHIRMRLSSMDLYDMEFLAIRAGKVKVKSKEKGVYGDQLGVMIKKNTGLNIRL